MRTLPVATATIDVAVALLVHATVLLILTAPVWAGAGIVTVGKNVEIARAVNLLDAATVRGLGIGMLAVATAFGVMFEVLVVYSVIREVEAWKATGVFVGYLSYVGAGVLTAHIVLDAID